MRPVKSLAVIAAALVGVAVAASAAFAQADYPNRPVRLIVGFPPGSSADIAARVVGARMTQVLGQQVVVESKPGAASSIAAAEVARAEKDGYTLFMLSAANVINEQINPKLSFNIAKDFAPVAMINTTAIILAVDPSLGLNNVKDLIALAKSKPGELNYASTGPGTVPHLAGELLAVRADIKIQHVPYKGSPEAATDLLAGRVSMMFSPASAVIAQGKEGKLKLLATAHRRAARRAARPADHGGGRRAGLRNRNLVRAGGAGRYAASGARQARQGGDRGDRGSGGRQGLGAAGHSAAQGRPRRPRALYRERNPALGRGGLGGGIEEIAVRAPERVTTIE